MFDTLSNFNGRVCHAYDVCKSLKDYLVKFPLDEIVNNFDEIPFMSNINCEQKFPECVAM